MSTRRLEYKTVTTGGRVADRPLAGQKLESLRTLLGLSPFYCFVYHPLLPRTLSQEFGCPYLNRRRLLPFALGRRSGRRGRELCHFGFFGQTAAVLSRRPIPLSSSSPSILGRHFGDC